MQAIKDSAISNSSRGFDSELTAFLKSRIRSATRMPFSSDFPNPPHDTRSPNMYMDSLIKNIQPFEEMTQNEASSEKSAPKIREFTAAFLPIKKPLCPAAGDVKLGKRAEMEFSDAAKVFEQFNGDFESDSEGILPEEAYKHPTKVDLRFLKFENVEQSQKSVRAVLDFKSFLRQANNRFEKSKSYECEICKQRFEKHAALGGHMSKIHPKTSKKFEERMNVYALRKGEREKRQFLNNLGAGN